MFYAGIVAIFDDAHDFDVRFAASARESDAQRIASREKILDELLIDNRDLRTAEIVALRKFTARDERDAQDLLLTRGVGAVGVVSVASNLFPAEIRALVHAYQSGDVKLAENLHRKLFPLFKDLFIEPNPVPVKTALGWRGAMSAECRLPLCEMSEANQERLRKSLAEFEQR